MDDLTKEFANQVCDYLLRLSKGNLIHINMYDDYKSYLILKFAAQLGNQN